MYSTWSGFRASHVAFARSANHRKSTVSRVGNGSGVTPSRPLRVFSITRSPVDRALQEFLDYWSADFSFPDGISFQEPSASAHRFEPGMHRAWATRDSPSSVIDLLPCMGDGVLLSDLTSIIRSLHTRQKNEWVQTGDEVMLFRVWQASPQEWGITEAGAPTVPAVQSCKLIWQRLSWRIFHREKQ